MTGLACTDAYRTVLHGGCILERQVSGSSSGCLVDRLLGLFRNTNCDRVFNHLLINNFKRIN